MVDFADAEGRPKKVGDTLAIKGEPFTIIGIYETGSMFLDVVLVMDTSASMAATGSR